MKVLCVSVASRFCAPGLKDILTLHNARAGLSEEVKLTEKKPSSQSTPCMFTLRAVTRMQLDLVLRAPCKTPSARAARTALRVSLSETWAGPLRRARSRASQPHLESPSSWPLWLAASLGSLSRWRLWWGCPSQLQQLVWRAYASHFNLKRATGITDFDLRIFSASATNTAQRSETVTQDGSIESRSCWISEGPFPKDMSSSLFSFFFLKRNHKMKFLLFRMISVKGDVQGWGSAHCLE